jgi:hypothetical protein
LILLLAVAAGLLAGLLRARITGRRLQGPDLRLMWLVPVAFLPQFIVFGLPTLQKLPDAVIAAILVSSQFLLLVFAWANRKHPGFWLLTLGLTLNLAVIALNGGFMPISPETVARLVPGAGPGDWQIGERLGTSKDLVLPYSSMRLGWLSDRFLLPDWFSYRVAFSLGDILIAAGSFWFFVARAAEQQTPGRLNYGD